MFTRRRAVMGGKSEGLAPVFELVNRATTKGERISTGFHPLASGTACTILFDYSFTEYPTSGTARLFKLIYTYNDPLSGYGLVLGKSAAYDQNLSAWFCGNANNVMHEDIKNYIPCRYRYAVIHAADANEITVFWKEIKTTKVTQRRSITISRTFTPSASNILYFGGPSTDHFLPNGTINLAKVYDAVLPSAEIDAFFAL